MRGGAQVIIQDTRFGLYDGCCLDAAGKLWIAHAVAPRRATPIVCIATAPEPPQAPQAG
jgi:sugar lactone lactonase YvrE